MKSLMSLVVGSEAPIRLMCICCRYYLQHCNVQQQAPARVCPQAWELLTVSNARKYLGVFDVLASAIQGWTHRTTTYINGSVLRTLQAMALHHSQWRWYGSVGDCRFWQRASVYSA